MTINNMTVGRDYAFGYYDANTGGMIDLGSVQVVGVTQPKHDIENRPYNDDPTFGYIGDGYRFTFTITRTSSVLEEFVLAMQERFRSGQAIQPGYLTETVANNDGSVNRYIYDKFVFWVNDLGSIQRETVVKITCEGKASRKRKIA
jgi:hypothetical protein